MQRNERAGLPGLNALQWRRMLQGSGLVARSGREQQRISTIQDFIQSVADVKLAMTDFAKMMHGVNNNVVRIIRETGEYGVGSGTLTYGQALFSDFTSMFGQFGTPLWTARDNLIETMKTVREAMNESLVSPLLMMGTNLKGAAAEFNAARGTNSLLRGGASDMYNNLNWRQQNMLFTQSLQTGRMQGGNMTSLLDPDVQRMARKNFEIWQQIAANTGMTVDELRKLTKEAQEDISAAVLMGGLSGADASNLTAAYTQAVAEGRKDMAALILQYAKLGGLQNENMLLGESANAAILQAQGYGVLDYLRAAQEAGIGGEKAGAMALRRYAQANQAAFGNQINPIINKDNFGLFKDFGKVAENNQAAQNDPIARVLNRFTEFFDNAGIFKDAITAMGTLTAAVWANTAAVLLSNAKLGGLIGGGLGKLTGKVLTGVKGAASGAGALAGMAGNAANSAVAASGGIMGSILRRIPIIGGIAGGGLTALAGGGLFESLLGGGGGVLGGLGGGALGALAGGFGAIPGSIAGGYGGAEAGGAAGRWLDQRLGFGGGGTAMAAPASAAALSDTVDSIMRDEVEQRDRINSRYDEMIDLLKAQNALLQKNVDVSEGIRAGIGGATNRDIPHPPIPRLGGAPRTTIGGINPGRS